MQEVTIRVGAKSISSLISERDGEKLQNIRVGAKSISSLISVLNSGTHSFAELQKATGLVPQAVSAWVSALRKVNLVRIGRWDRDSRGYCTIPCFTWGHSLPDTVKPTLTATQRVRSWRERQKASGVSV